MPFLRSPKDFFRIFSIPANATPANSADVASSPDGDRQNRPLVPLRLHLQTSVIAAPSVLLGGVSCWSARQEPRDDADFPLQCGLHSKEASWD